MTNITLHVTLDQAQRQAVMAQVRSSFPETAGTTQAINASGIFRIQAIGRNVLPADLTADTVRSIVLEVVATTEATRPGTFTTTRRYDRSGQRTRKPHHPSWSN